MNRDFKGVWIPREVYLAKDLSWSEKILLIEIDSLDNDAEKGCYASNGHLAEFLDVSPMTVSNMISKLRQAGYIQQLFFDGKNRGLRSRFHGKHLPPKQSSKLHKKMEDKLHKKVNDPPQKNGAYPPQKSGHSNTVLKIQEKEGGNAAKPKPVTDERKCHPAIVAIREIAELYPPKETWDKFITVLGADLDVDRLRECFVAWRLKGWKPTNYAWALEWYPHGIPNFAANGNGTRPNAGEPSYFKGSPVTVDDFASILPERPLRPAANVPPEQQRVWQAVLDALQKKLNRDVFATWFKPLVFDGFNAENNAFEVRGSEITIEWIKLYYAGMIAETLPDLGLGDFTIHWTLDDGEYGEALA
ncbi:MAG TPA: DnaA N-terminal domain-containing protein, partial [Pyrinomonadaceae bacterium]|nr:DnaA N-terminal domain-containing protein [Pyrinomonadaceae bacterium]